MINTRKYQTGGAMPQGGGGIMDKIAQLPLDQLQLIMQAFAQWAQSKGIDVNQVMNNPNAMEQAMTLFMQEMQQSQAQAAKHGAKLQYIKDLKGTCPDGTHLEYYKAGGRLCKKCMKNQEGGKVKEEKKGGVLSQYKEKVKKDCGGAKMKACGGAKMKKHQIGGTIETLRESLGFEKKNYVSKALGGLKIGSSNKSNGSTSQANVLPEVIVKGNRPYRFDRRTSDIGNGYKIISDMMYDEYNSKGEYMGDLSGIMGGRAIYQTPFGNDTVYGGKQVYSPNATQRYRLLGYDTGFMEVPMNRTNQGANRANFYRMIKRSHVSPYSDQEEKQAFKRAKRGN